MHDAIEKEKALTDVIAGFTVVITASVINGVVVSFLWQWFIANTLNVPNISIANGIGIMILFRTLSGSPDDTNSEMPFVERMLISIAASLVILAFGWLISLFV